MPASSLPGIGESETRIWKEFTPLWTVVRTLRVRPDVPVAMCSSRQYSAARRAFGPPRLPAARGGEGTRNDRAPVERLGLGQHVAHSREEAAGKRFHFARPGRGGDLLEISHIGPVQGDN